MGKAGLGHSIEKAKQDRSDRLSKEEEIQEYRNQVHYYKSMGLAINATITRLKEDYILCQKNAKLNQSRLDKLKGVA